MTTNLPKHLEAEQPPIEDSSDDEGHYDLKRRSNESSPTVSVYDRESTVAEETANKAQPVKEYSLFNSPGHLDIYVLQGSWPAKDTDPEKEALYYVDNSLLPKKADVTLRHGPGKHGNIVGVCRLRFGFGTYHIGLGDPEDDRTEWEDMKRHGAFKTRNWQFSMPVHGSTQRHAFTWKRTRDEHGHGNPVVALGNKKLVDEETNEVVAVYLINHVKSWKKLGKLVIYKDYGSKWQLMVLISLLSLIEKKRRKIRAGLSYPFGYGPGP